MVPAETHHKNIAWVLNLTALGRPALHISVSYGKVRLFEVDFY